MALADLVQKSEVIKVGDAGEFTVHPLTVEGLAVLLANHREQIESLFSGTADVSTLISEAPEFVSSVIAISSREEGDAIYDVAKSLPVCTQVIALNAIWGLTVYDPKEFMAVVQHLLSLMGVEQEENSSPNLKITEKPTATTGSNS